MIPAGVEPVTFRFVAQHLNHCATAVPINVVEYLRHVSLHYAIFVLETDKIKERKEIFLLPVVLYGCETWSLTLREERKLRVFENMVLRRIFGPRRDEVTREWRRLHNVELNDLLPSAFVVELELNNKSGS